MTFSMSNGTETVTPWDRLGFETSNPSRTIVHELLDGSIAVTLRPALPRTGTMQLLFLTDSEAEAARLLLAQPAVWTVTDPLTGVDGLRVVVSGEIGNAQQDDRRRWVLAVGYQEVPA